MESSVATHKRNAARGVIGPDAVYLAKGSDVETETPNEPGSTSLMKHSAASWRCIIQIYFLFCTVTIGKRPIDNRGIVSVAAGETADSPERRQSGQNGSASLFVAFVRKHPTYATSNSTEQHPRGMPRGGENDIPTRTDQTVTTLANVQRTLNAKCICGKECKNIRGLKIHQARMKCLIGEGQLQRTGVQPGQTREEPSRETHHSAQPLLAPSLPRPDKVPSKRIKWPPANDREAWRDFDSDVCSILESSSGSCVDSRLNTLSTIIVSYAAERFGCANSEKKIYIDNRRTVKIKELRRELKSLRKQYKKASEEERQPLAELRDILRRRLTSIRRAEGHRKRRKERSRKRTAFITNPFGFARTLLGDKRSGQLNCSADTVNAFLRETLSDPEKDTDLGRNDRLIEPEPPTSEFDLREPSWREIQDVVNAARSSSAPGPSGVMYCVYKRCPGLLSKLWKIIKTIWRRGKIAEQWRFAEGVWIPKEENSENIDQFRSISLLSTESKIFFGILSRRLTKFLLSNGYIDTSVQKGGIPGVPGCLEHTGVVSQLLKEAKEGKKDLAVLWLDLANAYGSIPHKLVEFALARHHVPSKVSSIILDYYNNFKVRISSGLITSDWHRLERGIITGCTISATLFALAMNMLAKSAEKECRGPITNSRIRHHP